MTQYYLSGYVENRFESYNLFFLCDELRKTELFTENIIQYYFEVSDPDEIRKYKELTHHEVILKIDELVMPEKHKYSLVKFFMNPEFYISMLISELKVLDVSMDSYYKKNYDTVLDMMNNTDFSLFEQAMNMSENRKFNFGNTPLTAFSCCLATRNIFRWIGDDNGLYFIFGQYGLDTIYSITKRKSNEDLVMFGKILSDPNRRGVLRLLSNDEELYTGEIAKKLNVNLTAIFYHLDMMLDAGILAARNEGRSVYYKINFNYFKKIAEELDQIIKTGEVFL